MLSVLIGFIFLVFALIRNRNIIRVEWNKVASFMGFMAIFTCFRISLFDLSMRLDVEGFYPQYPKTILEEGFWPFMTVWWEDMFYVFPMFYIIKYLPKHVAGIFIVIMSMDFGAGHLYQGTTWAIIASFYPFIAYLLGKKYGLGTVMICHILYDFLTVLTLVAAATWIF